MLDSALHVEMLPPAPKTVAPINVHVLTILTLTGENYLTPSIFTKHASEASRHCSEGATSCDWVWELSRGPLG